MTIYSVFHFLARYSRAMRCLLKLAGEVVSFSGIVM